MGWCRYGHGASLVTPPLGSYSGLDLVLVLCLLWLCMGIYICLWCLLWVGSLVVITLLLLLCWFSLVLLDRYRESVYRSLSMVPVES